MISAARAARLRCATERTISRQLNRFSIQILHSCQQAARPSAAYGMIAGYCAIPISPGGLRARNRRTDQRPTVDDSEKAAVSDYLARYSNSQKENRPLLGGEYR